MSTLNEVLRRVRTEGTFSSWGHKPSAARLQEDSTAFRASMCLRDAITAIYEADKLVGTESSRAEVVPHVVGALRHMALAMEQIGQLDAAGALGEVGDYIDEVRNGEWEDE